MSKLDEAMEEIADEQGIDVEGLTDCVVECISDYILDIKANDE